jgi:hypothetical protein
MSTGDERITQQMTPNIYREMPHMTTSPQTSGPYKKCLAHECPAILNEHKEQTLTNNWTVLENPV